MITVTLLSRNGQTLPAEEKVILLEGRVVWAEEPADGAETEKILYAKSLDRRDSPDLLVIEEDGVYADLVEDGFVEVQVLWEDDTTSVVAVNPVFIEYIKDSQVYWNNTKLDCVAITYTEGAFLHKRLFAVGQVGDNGVIVTTTTTTEEEVTTTTTTEEEVTTTTTTE
jgi:hypothetical protein